MRIYLLEDFLILDSWNIVKWIFSVCGSFAGWVVPFVVYEKWWRYILPLIPDGHSCTVCRIALNDKSSVHSSQDSFHQYPIKTSQNLLKICIYYFRIYFLKISGFMTIINCSKHLWSHSYNVCSFSFLTSWHVLFLCMISYLLHSVLCPYLVNVLLVDK